MSKSDRLIIEVTVVGKDRKGVVADITNFIFKNDGNIEQINQDVINGLFGMQLEASFQQNIFKKTKFDNELKALGNKLKMEIKIHYQEPKRLKNIAIFVSKETHCLLKLLDAKTTGEIKANIVVIIGSENTTNSIAEKFNIPFYHVVHSQQTDAENEILDILDRYNVDLIVLGRYMRILTPNFVWRYPDRIINIHPSLLPAFPGAYAYVQAYERGAKIVGCTAHFVTKDLDQGPIICQESFRVRPEDSVKS
ncbi:MAG TPA: formyltetrahydrofolate deformylase, partial [Nitrososphaeraceae archaeon]|nr:formyltetrahydrofolate deformylase [Nitrososphaeraceae archaeon]